MEEVIKFLIKWLKKNKTLFVFVFSAVLFILYYCSPYNKEQDSLTLYLLKIFLLSFGITRILVYFNVIRAILSIPVVSDFIFFCGREERFLIKSFEKFKTDKVEDYNLLKKTYETPVIRIKSSEITEDNLGIISLLKTLEHYNFLEDYKITNNFKELKLDENIKSRVKSQIQPDIKNFYDFHAAKCKTLDEGCKNLSDYLFLNYQNAKHNSGEILGRIDKIKRPFLDIKNEFDKIQRHLSGNILNDDILISFTLKPAIERQLSKLSKKK